MLKGLDPLLHADLLHALRAMGHGDELVLADTNFPASSLAAKTTLGRLIRLDGVDAPRALRAILSVLPLDTFVDHAVNRMEVVGNPHEVLPVMREAQAEIDRAEGRSTPMGTVERFAFYERAAKAFCIIQTGEGRFYGDFLVKKGIIPPAS